MSLEAWVKVFMEQEVGTIGITNKGAVWYKGENGWIRPGWDLTRGTFALSDKEMADTIHESQQRAHIPAIWSFL